VPKLVPTKALRVKARDAVRRDAASRGEHITVGAGDGRPFRWWHRKGVPRGQEWARAARSGVGGGSRGQSP
jgi:hypothetical protein